ncbi:MAG: hypothetical protein LAN84_10800 [Acidobacteriia bacterium]|nr:hypothetical protein [Terriglobia bacterium]
MPEPMDASRARRLIEGCLRRELAPDAALPRENVDLVEEGVLDSMAWVSFLRALESSTGAPDLGSLLMGRPSSIESVLAAIAASDGPTVAELPVKTTAIADGPVEGVFLVSSGTAFGSRNVPSEEVDREFGMPVGKLRKRAGILSIARVAEGESELTLGARAAQQALRAAGCGAGEVDWILATSETHHSYPSLGAQLHSLLLARESCGVLDIGGACLGLLNALAAARAFLAAGQARTILVVSADVHSRILAPGRVVGEFGGLFGDGASAFLLRARADGENAYRLGEFQFGCAGQYAAAIRVASAEAGAPGGALEVQFDGEALSRAAVSRMEKVLHDAALRSGFALAEAAGFATHQPNPRLVELLARHLGVPVEKFPLIARTCGNLGSSTCGAALHTALAAQAEVPAAKRKPVFLASLGPGLLFGGGWVEPAAGRA